MKPLISAVLIALAVGCTTRCDPTSVVVSADELDSFLHVVSTHDPIRIDNAGRQLFVRNKVVPRHASRFEGFGAHSQSPDTVCYNLFNSVMTTNDHSIVDIYLELEERTGRVVSFFNIEI